MPEENRSSETTAQPPADGTKPGDKPVKKEPWGKAIATLAFWLGLIIFLKVFVADIFVIPTGSMEPTLHGRDNRGDRIFCTKINYLWRNPQRWEIFVFKFPYLQSPEGERSPYKGENYIKRCVGLPGETIALRRGDVFVGRDGLPLQRQIKSPAIQVGLWIPVYREDFSDRKLEELSDFWRLTGWTLEKGELVSAADGGVLTFRPHDRFEYLNSIPDRYVRRQYVDFACPASDCGGKLRKTVDSPMIAGRCPRCGRYLTERDVVYYDFRCDYPLSYRLELSQNCKLGDPQLRDTNWHGVPDLRLRTRARLEPGASVELQIFDDRHLCAAKFVAGSAQVQVTVDGAALSAALLRPQVGGGQTADGAVTQTSGGEKPTGLAVLPGGALTPGVWHDLDFQRVDGTLRIFVNGRQTLVSGLFDVGIPEDNQHPQTANVDVLTQGGVRLSRLAIDRDIYYYHDEQSFRFLNREGVFRLPENGYLALGDNQPASNDSRSWGAVPQENLVGTAHFTWWPPQALRLLNRGQ